MTGKYQVRLRGYRDRRLVESAIDDGMIDIAYVNRVEDDHIVLMLEPEIDAAKDEDFEWLCSVVQQTLTEVGETTVIVDRIAAEGASPSD